MHHKFTLKAVIAAFLLPLFLVAGFFYYFNFQNPGKTVKLGNLIVTAGEDCTDSSNGVEKDKEDGGVENPAGIIDGDKDGTNTSENDAEKDKGSDGSIASTSVEKYCYIFVCGQVNNPDVYKIKEGGRVYDAIAAAGGFTDDADIAYHNLANLLTDSLRLYVPSLTETESLSVSERIFINGGGLGENGKKSPESSPDNSGPLKVDINSDDPEELMKLPGIGASKATAILTYRERAGDFKSIEEIMNVTGIGEASFERLKEFIYVSVGESK